MSDHPLDPALRAQAERRRAELTRTPEMPGPMRAALQREVAKVHADEPPRVTWLDRLFRWQAFFATAATAVLTVGLFGYSQGWFAGAQRMPRSEEQAAVMAPAPAPATGGNARPAGERSVADDRLAKTKKADVPAAVREEQPAPPASTAAAKPAEATEAKREYRETSPPVVAAVPEQPRTTDELKLAEPMTERRRLDADQDRDVADGRAVLGDSTARPPPPAASAPGSSLAGVAPAKPATVRPAPAPKAALPSVATSAPPPAAAPAPIVRGFLGGAASQGAAGNAGNTASAFGNSQRFVQSPAQLATRNQRARPETSKQIAAESLLNDFTLSQTGNAIVVTDRDGSEYRGQIVPDNSQTRARRSQGQRVAKDVDQLSDGFAFRASGVSKSLGQRVTIEAEVEPAPSLAAVGDAKEMSRDSKGQQEALRQLPADPSNQSQLQLQIPQQNRKGPEQQRLRLVGEVRVNKEVVEVEAVSEN